MNNELKKHINKVLKALNLLKKWKYLPDVQRAISYSYSLLDSLCSEGELDKKGREALKSSLNKIKTDVLMGNKEIIDSINEIFEAIN